MRRVEYAKPLFSDESCSRENSVSNDNNNNTLNMVARNVVTQRITRDEFLKLAENFDPTQSLVQKKTKRFLSGLHHLTVVTFLKPDELKGVSRVVGPASLRVEELPSWMEVDDQVSMMGGEGVM
ncbi:hypothetical protein AGDE_05696 [Angomonas deanei]|nr:hypothetical protein AGDE_05696 [Angomonas deanei]|eukprot:EPY38235.1 hypothetical protein AGDE_05696 [Angomonas deanei]